MNGLRQKGVVGIEEALRRNLLVDRRLEGLLDHRNMRWQHHGAVVGGDEAAGVHRRHCNCLVRSRPVVHIHPVVGTRLVVRIRLGCSRSRRIQT